MKYILFALLVAGTLGAGASVTGQIGRMQVTDTTRASYRMIGQINDFCTGTLIGPRLVLTAGHCAYDLENKKYLPIQSFTPGRQETTEPFGRVAVEKFYVSPSYLQGDMSQDVAVLVLREAIGLKTGWMKVGYDLPYFQAHNSLLGGLDGSGTITGYPGDKPDGTMWLVACSFYVPSMLPQIAQYNCDTYGGMSGSALVVGDEKGEPVVIGVHNLGRGHFNSGVILSYQNKAFLQAVIAQHPL